MKLSMIVAMAENRVIGRNNKLPWYLPEDLKYFKKVTMGKPIIMGRNTFESIGRPLPGRRNIVISRNLAYQATGVEVVASITDALALVADIDEVMVIGGGAIYRHCIAMATRLYVTHIAADLVGDTYFPDFDTVNIWQKTASEFYPADANNIYDLDFCLYQRKG